jgi:uncharacterized protein YjbJ (UPF0337 family)
MKSSTKNQINGKIHKGTGSVKEASGKLLNDPALEAKGKAERVEGQIQDTIGRAEKKLGK